MLLACGQIPGLTIVPTQKHPTKKAAMIEVICNDRVGKKVRVKCNEDDTIGDLKKLIAAQVGTRPEKIRYVTVVVYA